MNQKLPHDIEREKQLQHVRQLERQSKQQVKPPQKKVGHEAALAKMVKERRKINIWFDDIGEATMEGEVLEFDKYSIRVARDSGECVWIFKSAMVGFAEVGKNVR